MKVQITAKALRAAGHCMATGDIRYYLNGVYLDVTGPTEAFVVGTDGTVLFAGRVELEYLEDAQNAPWTLIIPFDVIKGLNKKASSFVLESLADGRYMLDGKVFSAIVGKFPDYRRVIPSPEELGGEAARYNPALLQRCVSAILSFYGLPKDSPKWSLRQGGPRAGVVYGQDDSAVAVVMPLFCKEPERSYGGFLSPCQSFLKAA